MLFKVTVMPMSTQLWLSANAPLTNIEHQCGGEGLIASGCRQGICGACAIEVTAGGELLGKKTGQEADILEMLGLVGAQFRLACQCKAGGDVTFRVATPE